MKPKKKAFEFDPAEEFPHLQAAPIVEAVIHWTARATQPFQPDTLRNQLAARLPEYPECQPQHELKFEVAVAADDKSTPTRQESWHGFRLTSADKLQIAQFNRDGLVFSRLKPYESWDVFSAEARRLWTLYLELANPSEVQRLGVRFINRIAPIELSKLRRYLTNPPRCLDSLGLPTSGFLYQSMHDVPGLPMRINVVQTIQPLAPPSTDGLGLILDVDASTTRAFPPSDDVLKDYLAKLRWLKDKAFFSLLKPTALSTFEKGIT